MMTKLGRTVLIACVMTLGLFDQTGANKAIAQSACFASLADGDVQGAIVGGACAFLGVPYAASTAGNNRWRPPQPPNPWRTVLNATAAPVACPSLAVVGPPTLSGDENCLTLNVWAPAPLPPGGAPVIVWFHTGAFIGASAFFPGTRGQRLAAETGVVVVAPNYRLGPFGFLAHAALAAEDPFGSSGNYGLLDQQAALRWVRDNIERFGGDPGNVTIAGTSAGGQSVGLQLVSPASAGLYHRAAIQSAYPTSRWTPRGEAHAQGDRLAAALGCNDPTTVLACMRARSRDAVLTALPLGVLPVVEPPGGAFWEPSVDGTVLPEQPRVLFESGAFQRVPTIIGFTRDEGWGAFITRSFPAGVSLSQYEAWVTREFGGAASDVLAMYSADASASPIEAMARVLADAQFVCEGRRLARAIEATDTPTFVYSYEHEIDTLSVDHVIHGVETNILFGNNYAAPVFPAFRFGPAEDALHAAMAGYWTRFARTGNPNRGDDTAASWPPFKRPNGSGRGNDKYLILDANIREGERLREAQCNLFEPLFMRSILGGVPASTP